MTQYQPAPVGEIEVEIVAASVAPVSWKETPENPTGECLRLRLSAGRQFSFVFADVPADWKSMLRAVRRAVGIEGDELVPEAFVGKRARVTIRHYEGKDGTTRAAVGRWLPMAVTQVIQPTPADAVVARPHEQLRRPAQKVSRNAPPVSETDDIPF